MISHRVSLTIAIICVIGTLPCFESLALSIGNIPLLEHFLHHFIDIIGRKCEILAQTALGALRLVIKCIIFEIWAIEVHVQFLIMKYI